MLSPSKNRLDYGEQLNPPSGYEFDAAVATSFSLDMDTLLAAPIALCFGDTLEGDIKGEKLAILEAFGRLEGKLKVFYQKGNIAKPASYNPLFTLLEPCLESVIPEGGEFSSFHPKLWLLRFVKKDKLGKKQLSVRYRLIVLSRNLTSDRSWDVAVSFEGEIKKREAKSDTTNKDWITFILNLLDKASPFAPADDFKRELKHVVWNIADNSEFKQTDNVELLIGGGEYGCPVEINEHNNDKLMVISPFIKKKALKWLASYAPNGERYLFSRAEELNVLGEKALEDWECFSINEKIIDGEELAALGSTAQNLHAKIIINQKWSRAHWHLGSANATNAALIDKGEGARNTESMVKLTGVKSKVGPDVLIDQWVDGSSGLFVVHEFEEPVEDTNAALEKRIRKVIYQLINADWMLEASKADDGKYDLNLSVANLEPLDESIAVSVSQLAIPGDSKLLCKSMIWECVDIDNVSALIPLEVVIDGLENDPKTIVVEASLNIEGGDVRQERILKKMFSSPEKILNYIQLMLQVSPDKNQWSLYEQGESGNGDSTFVLSNSPILEQLLLAASRHPDLLKRIQKMLNKLDAANVDIPDNFRQLWLVFEKEIID